MQDVITIPKPAPPALVAELAPMVQDARDFVVHNAESHQTALDREARLRRAERAIEEWGEPSKKAAAAAHKTILASIAALVGPIAEARRIYGAKSTAHEERERARVEDEARVLRELARKQEEERKLADAVEAELAGDAELAAQIIDEPITVPTIAVRPEVAPVSPVVTQTRWSAEVTDIVALVKYVAAHPEWIGLVTPNSTALNRLAVSTREALAIPGVRAVSNTVRVTR